MNLEELAKTARDLANALFLCEEAPCGQQKAGQLSCIQKEEERPITRAEKQNGWTRRPFSAYDTNRMCAGCLAYYHAEFAAQTLHELYCWQRRIEAIARANPTQEKPT